MRTCVNRKCKIQKQLAKVVDWQRWIWGDEKNNHLDLSEKKDLKNIYTEFAIKFRLL